jgi:hypothetical protein
MSENLEVKIKQLEERVSILEHRLAGGSVNTSLGAVTDVKSVDKRVSIKEFLYENEPKNDVQRTLLIGYFLEHLKGYSSFNKSDIEDQYRAAKVPVPKNINDKVNMCIKNRFMMENDELKDGMKSWVLTMTGEKTVQDKKFNQ